MRSYAGADADQRPFVSRDAGTRSGRPVSITLTGQTNVTIAKTAQHVRISDFTGDPREWPKRYVEIGDVRVETVRDRLEGS